MAQTIDTTPPTLGGATAPTDGSSGPLARHSLEIGVANDPAGSSRTGGARAARRLQAARRAEAEDTLRAIAAGEIDAFVMSDGSADGRFFTLATADRPYRMLVQNMRDARPPSRETG